MKSLVFKALVHSLAGMGVMSSVHAQAGDLRPIEPQQWTRAHAAHLLERSAFGGTPQQIDALHAQGMAAALASIGKPDAKVPPLPVFEHSGIFDAGLEAFPPSRPATTDAAKARGEALGIRVKPSGNRRLQPVVNQFFYWLRASRLESDRVAYWWADRMLNSSQPLQEKLALFWHGHFATNEDKVRDYRKMLMQVELFQREGLGDFRSLLVAVAKDPAMLVFLDAGVNVKGAPNENFAREIMELFSMGVGQYTEQDIREAARAFTGWNVDGLAFRVDPVKHDSDLKSFLGQRGRFDGEQVIDIILQHPATAPFIATKLYRYFVRDDVSPAMGQTLGESLRSHRYQIRPFLAQLFASRDFYAPESIGTRIKGPVELAVSTYRKMGLNYVPGIPDLNDTTSRLGQRLLHPPTVAGWAQGRAWITPSLLMERGNFAFDLLFPDVAHVSQDRYAMAPTGDEVRAVQQRIRAGADMTTATRPVGRTGGVGAAAPGAPPASAPTATPAGGDSMALSNQMVDRDEDFNTRYASYRGWQMAIERVKPITRRFARLDLSQMIKASGAATPLAVVQHFEHRFLTVPLDTAARTSIAAFLERELGTADVHSAYTFAEEALRQTLHIVLSRPEYQLH